MISFKQKGNFNNLEKFLTHNSKFDIRSILERYGRVGVDALSAATPIDTGETASSWGYYVEVSKKRSRIVWTNSNRVNGVNIAVILQYGHATGWGSYVQGRPYINQAIEPIMTQIALDVWKEVCDI